MGLGGILLTEITVRRSFRGLSFVSSQLTSVRAHTVHVQVCSVRSALIKANQMAQRRAERQTPELPVPLFGRRGVLIDRVFDLQCIG
jgi:hypothetical protein